MDICVLNPFFHPYKGGTEKVLFEVYRRLAKRHNVTVLTSGKHGARQDLKEEIEGIEIVRLKASHIRVPLAPLPFVAATGLNRMIKRLHCEIYHINNRYQYFYDNVAAIKKINGKIALTIHNSLPIGIDSVVDSLGLAYDMAWGRALMHDADLITGISRNAIDMTVPKKEHWKTHLVYNGVDYNLFRPMGRDSKEVAAVIRELGGTCGSNEANIVTNGRLIEQKGQVYLIRAVADLVKEGRDLGLLVIGRGPLEESLFKEAQMLGLSERFWIRNGIEENDLPSYYNIGDAFVLPSLYEPASLVILEALACAVPSIASKVGGLPEMMDSYGLYVKPKSTEDIKARLLYALENRKRMESLARKGREFIIKRHDWDSISKKYEELFLKTLRY
jgi:glycosyltransferase involved in cell wall biosynthesis